MRKNLHVFAKFTKDEESIWLGKWSTFPTYLSSEFTNFLFFFNAIKAIKCFLFSLAVD